VDRSADTCVVRTRLGAGERGGYRSNGNTRLGFDRPDLDRRVRFIHAAHKGGSGGGSVLVSC